jgi:hypothetical protein
MKALLLVLAVCSGCISADFHSKNGRTYPTVTERAVIVDDDELAAVMAAGAEDIGTISGAGMAINSQDDVTEKATRVAAEHGGTHVVVTASDRAETTWEHPATVTKQCSNDGEGNRSCEKTFQPAYESTSSRPVAAYRVLRVPAQNWGALPDQLRPAP